MVVDRLNMQFYSLGHPRGSHIQEEWFDMGNLGYDEDGNERAYDELRQSFTGIPQKDLRGDDLPGNLAWRPFGSLLPDTAYYRDPDSYVTPEAFDGMVRNRKAIDPLAYLEVVNQFRADIHRIVGKSHSVAPSYEQQRLADSVQERLEVRRVLAEASADAGAKGKRHAFSVADVRHYENHEGWERGEAFEVRGHSTLVRTEERVIGTFQTPGLEPGAWTMWWIFYNHPSACENPLFDPDGNQLSQCSFQDRLIDEVGRSPGWGSSSVVGDNGIGNFASVKDVGDDATGSPAEVNLCCPIVTNPLGAEIHILMRYHGPVDDDLLFDQLFTWGGGCNYDPALNRGMPGDFDCVDPAMAVHPGSPRQDSREDDD
jgi:hypothetical protein